MEVSQSSLAYTFHGAMFKMSGFSRGFLLVLSNSQCASVSPAMDPPTMMTLRRPDLVICFAGITK